MIFGSKTQTAAPKTPSSSANNAFIFDVAGHDFEERVLKASMDKPVIVDFWAPWCGPCKQLMPLLEKAVNGADGEVLLAKVNIDQHPDLASAMQIKSVPTVYAFFAGRPVDAFQGAQPESAIKTFVANLVQIARASQPGALDIPEALKLAAAALAQGDLAGAQNLYAQILQQDEKNVDAYVGIIRVLITGEALDQAQALITNAPPEIAKHTNFSAAKTALELAQKAPKGGFDALTKKVADNPKDHQARIDLAEAQFASGHKEEAMDTILASIELDLNWNEQAARKTLLKFFEALGHADPLTVSGRKKLSALLFS